MPLDDASAAALPSRDQQAAEPILALDTLVNLVSGFGTAKDKHVHARFVGQSCLSRLEIDTLYGRSWLGGKLVDIPADDATREWRQWHAAQRDVEAIEEEERRLKIRQAVNWALKLARKDGGSAIVLGAGGGGEPEDPAEPLRPERLPRGGLRFVHVVARWDVECGPMDRDPLSPTYGQPRFYRFLRADGRPGQEVHPSRVVPFVGVPRADCYAGWDPWGESVYERLRDAIRDATAAVQGAAALIQEAKIDICKVPGLTQGLQRDDYRQAVMTRFALAAMMKSLHNMLVLDAQEEWDQKQIHFAGFPEMIDRFLQVVAGAGDMPVTRLLGRAPAGLNATGEADLRNWYDHVAARQEVELRPALERLDVALVRSALGRTPRGIYFEWRPLWRLSEANLAEIALKRAQTAQVYAATGLFRPEALQRGVLNRLIETGDLPGIDVAVGQFPGIGTPQALAGGAASGGSSTGASPSAGGAGPSRGAEPPDPRPR